MKTSGQKHFDRDYSYRWMRNKLHTLRIIEYLTNYHNIQVPKNFSSQLLVAHQESYSSSFNISFRTIDAIVHACELFDEYVLSLNQLVCFEILTMARIHTCVISKTALAKDLIPLRKEVPINLKAIVKKNGRISVTAKHL